jgi:hypothetical protein
MTAERCHCEERSDEAIGAEAVYFSSANLSFDRKANRNSVEGAPDRVGAAEAVLFPSNSRYWQGSPLLCNGVTITSACAGGTTASSAPWNSATGTPRRSVKWIGERSL